MKRIVLALALFTTFALAAPAAFADCIEQNGRQYCDNSTPAPAAQPAPQAPVVQPAVAVRPACYEPARWVWRGYWSCEHRPVVYYSYTSYPYYGVPPAGWFVGGVILGGALHGHGHR